MRWRQGVTVSGAIVVCAARAGVTPASPPVVLSHFLASLFLLPAPSPALVASVTHRLARLSATAGVGTLAPGARGALLQW
jgi:hypothetical protein